MIVNVAYSCGTRKKHRGSSDNPLNRRTLSSALRWRLLLRDCRQKYTITQNSAAVQNRKIGCNAHHSASITYRLLTHPGSDYGEK